MEDIGGKDFARACNLSETHMRRIFIESANITPSEYQMCIRDSLHALVVAMLRLQTETMAGNKGASNILSISDEELGKIKDQILERISIVAPMAYESASDDIDAFISTWKEIAKDENLSRIHTSGV